MVTQYDNTHYDDGTNAQTLTGGNYAALFFYREVSNDKTVFMVLGGGDYSLAQAQASTPPSGLPAYIGNHTLLIGRMIVLKSATSATQIDSAFTTVFASTPVSDHNQLSNRDVIGNHQRLIPVTDSDDAIQITKADGTPVFNVDTVDSSIYVSGVGTPPAVFADAKFNAWDTTNSWVQNNIQNLSNGATASADHIATNDIGDDTNHFIDMGINSSGWSSAGWTINGASDGYIYTAGGNTAVGTTSNYVDIFTNGLLAANRVARFSSTGLSVTGTVAGSNLSGSNTGDQTKIQNLIGGNNTTQLGSIPYQSNTDTTTLLTPNTTIQKKFLRQTGTGSNGAAPAWDTIVVGDIPNMTATATGMPPTTPNDTAKFLRGDGTWAAPAASGLNQQQIMAISSMRV